MNHVSLFAGIGGTDLAFERAGVPTTAAVEIDPSCRRLLQARFPTTELYEDVREVTGRELRGADGPVGVLSGGWPCQDVSVAGRRAGLAGERSGLFSEFARLADECGARWVVGENVPGLLTSNGGRDLAYVLDTLVELGYCVAFRTLDARYFGVPQRRRRLVIVGRLGDEWRAPGEVLALQEGVRGDPPARAAPWTDVAALTANGVGTCGADDNQAQAGHLVFVKTHRAVSAEDNEIWRLDDVVPTLNVFDQGDSRAVALAVQLPIAFSHTHVLDEQASSVVAPTIMAGAAKQGAVATDAVRRLTPLECERLQGFPDHWTEGFSDSTRYRMLGNAVAVPVFTWLARRLVALDRGEAA